MKEIPNKYKHGEVEERWRNQWEEWGIYRWDPSRPKEETFVVDTPPPTVSGSLHIGHCFSYTHQDLIVRYQRMLGRNIHYGMGWDDNGLPTERRVQNVLGIRCEPHLPYDPDWKPRKDKGKKEAVEEVSRQNFIEACGLITEEDEKAFEELWRHLGLSIDWDESYTTIDEGCRRVSQYSFLDLVKKGRVYQVKSPTMWDVDFRTAVAQAEVEDRERPGAMHDIRFGLSDGGEFVISTTRPELLAACIAVVAHPDDDRYKPHFGKKAITPLYKAEVPILPAEHADPEKGTGILMVCTFGDAMDVEWWKQSDLALKQTIGRDGRLMPAEFGPAPFTSLAPEEAQTWYDQIAGLTAKQAKAKMAEILAQDGTAVDGNGAAMIGEPKPLTHPVKFYEKGDRPLEFVSTRQWFVKILEHKDALLAQGRKIEWHPSFMHTRYQHWVEGLNQDWCISRQRYFGVPFPVWYPVKEDGSPDYDNPIYASEESLPIDSMSATAPGYTEEQRDRPGGFTGDPDVMDTWATSSLTPQVQTHWGTDAERHAKLFPMDIRPQSHEIIRTWAFYTIVKAWMHEDVIPWKHVIISGWILDPDRKKMSKSKGNAVTPLEFLDQHSVDAVRYWAGRARLGTDTAFDETTFKIGKRLATKIFNASRFVFLQLDRVLGEGPAPGLDQVTHALDAALLARLRAVIEQATRSFDRYEYAPALQTAEDTFWDFCDNYLELVKTRSYEEEDTPGRRSAVATLRFAIRAFLRLFAPFLPYVTEEVWSWRFAGDGAGGGAGDGAADSAADSAAGGAGDGAGVGAGVGAGGGAGGRPESSIHVAPWPAVEEFASMPEPGNEEVFVAASEVLAKVRGAKSEAKKSLKWPVATLEIVGVADDLAALDLVMDDVLRAGAVEPDGVVCREADPGEGGRFAVHVTLAEQAEA